RLSGKRRSYLPRKTDNGCAGDSIGRRRQVRNEKGKNMKKVILSMALALAAPLAWAQVSQTTSTTTTTEGTGTITEFTPGSTIVLKETAGPKHYRFGKKVVYVTRSGKELDE